MEKPEVNKTWLIEASLCRWSPVGRDSLCLLRHVRWLEEPKINPAKTKGNNTFICRSNCPQDRAIVYNEPTMNPSKQKLLSQMRSALRRKSYSVCTEEVYSIWVDRFIRFYRGRTAQEMGEAEIGGFLDDLALKQKVAASTQSQAFSALLFFYRDVLQRELKLPLEYTRAQGGKPLPIVLTREEAPRAIECLSGMYQLMAKLLYGSGLRLAECVRLRVGDIDFKQRHLTVRDAHGRVDRSTILPESLIGPLLEHLTCLRGLHQDDLIAGQGAASLPLELERQDPEAGCRWIWQYVFPAERLSEDPRTGRLCRHHVSESSLQKAVAEVGRLSGIDKKINCNTLRHSFAAHLLESGCDIKTVQRLLGHKNLKSTLVYTQILEPKQPPLRSPLD